MADYIDDLNKKLASSRKRVRMGKEMAAIKASAPTLFEIIDGEITLAVSMMTKDTALSYDEYLDLHGKVVGMKRIRDLINAKEDDAVGAAQEVASIEGQLKQFKNDSQQ